MFGFPNVNYYLLKESQKFLLGSDTFKKINKLPLKLVFGNTVRKMFALRIPAIVIRVSLASPSPPCASKPFMTGALHETT
ncbi:hypothetical protein A3I42_04200 [Candidatus Uhrbacteria bacterium RIFCSPLOWO2_02_FULL_49_11]|uniref:Uncharacterized protein n=1 Tax=Candidatus Uhrbacteria bacterium RIFCSPLOWO2_02_FULL_49_11 TaxID=1802409 RepID=A0A1F7VAN0_9BACT|nr:MAG: hypothetical protein A3I42_04200 [Candidatus Uhrbacteria bacterium RIFCSPLOWO2_02_FULL_49_11]